MWSDFKSISASRIDDPCDSELTVEPILRCDVLSPGMELRLATGSPFIPWKVGTELQWKFRSEHRSIAGKTLGGAGEN